MLYSLISQGRHPWPDCWVSEAPFLKRCQAVLPSSRAELRIWEPRANFSPRPIICSIGPKNSVWADVENLEDKPGVWAGLELSIIDGVILYFSFIEYRFPTLRLELSIEIDKSMALFYTFLLSNVDSSLRFNYRFPTLDMGMRTKHL